MARYFTAKIDGTDYKVTMGYDVPLEWFFMTVENTALDDEDGRYVYSNLNEAQPRLCTLDYFQRVCASMGIELPEQLVLDVLEDREQRRMNLNVDYGVFGPLEPPEIIH